MKKDQDTFDVIEPGPTPEPLPPVPDSAGAMNVRLILALGLPVAYFALLLMLHVFWLAFNHPDLQSVCLIGDGIFSSATTTIVGHFIGAQTTATGVQHGVALMQRR